MAAKISGLIAGSLDMIRLCTEVGLPESDFRSNGGRLRVVVWRDWLKTGVFATCDLNSRQRQVTEPLRTRGKMTKADVSKGIFYCQQDGFTRFLPSRGHGPHPEDGNNGQWCVLPSAKEA